MKETCVNCKSSRPVNKATLGKSLEFQASIIATKKSFTGKERREKLVEVRESAEYSDLLKVKGLDSLSTKPTDPKEGSVYVQCSNAQHLKDEKAEGGVVHKTYFKCPHFAAI